MRSRVQCRVMRRGDVTHIAVAGRLDAKGQPRVADAVWRAVSPGGTVVVDLSKVTYFDSTGLWTLLGIERIAERQNSCSVELRGIEDAAFAVTGLS